jgi:hypothetical protein
VPVLFEFNLFAQGKSHEINAIAFKHFLTDIIVSDLKMAYAKIDDLSASALMGGKKETSFDYFLMQCLMSGGVRVRLVYGYKVDMLDLHTDVTLGDVQQAAEDMRRSEV